MENERLVHVADAIEWLNKSPVLLGSSLVASLPDISEFPELTLLEWKTWFIQTAKLILSRTPDDGVAVFFQSDIKLDKIWIDKGYLCQKAAEEAGHVLLWHKVVCKAPAGKATFGKPSYSHLLCFSKNVRPDLAHSTPDVMPEVGEKTWQRGMGLEVCLTAARFILSTTQTKTVVNPFCGEGSMLAAANAVGLKAIGIERSPKRAEKALKLQLDLDKKKWVEGTYLAPF